MKRTFGGIQFTRIEDGYSRPGDRIPHWISEDGIKLFCGGLRGPLSAHWEITTPDGRRNGGMSADEVLTWYQRTKTTKEDVAT